MSSRRPLQPIPALSANMVGTRYTRTTTTSKAADGHVDMEDHVQDELHESGSAVSGLTSLEGDDDFERQMIQHARDERRLKEASHGRAQPFRKARTHARVGLTLDNLERNDAQHGAGVTVKSPPSSSASTRSDPAIHAPASWGRKGRPARNWMRAITRDERPQQTPALPDSPLSHKSFAPGSPNKDDSGELDLTFEMPEASIIASTPYIPRNTRLDDIRAREMESLREQRVATARLDRTRSQSPEEVRRSSTGPAMESHSTVDTAAAQSQNPGSPARRLRSRGGSWQALSRSQPEPSQEDASIAVYRKSVETVGVVERGVVASAERQPARPDRSRRTDSQDLLRRLARASNTPSPKAVAPAARPQTYHSPQTQTAVAETSDIAPAEKEYAANAAQESIPAPREPSQRAQRQDTPHDGTTPDVPSAAPTTEDIDATPVPAEHTILNPKTPLVMGGWIDTPGPRTAHKPIELPRPRSRSQSPEERSRPSMRPMAPSQDQETAAEAPEATPLSLPRPQLPSSALHALVQEARVSHDYGEDTIHSLEDLMTPLGDNEVEEDTLQGLALPTSAPRNEAERERQAEVVQIHRLNQHLRATKTRIRDTSRGMSRVGTRVERIEVEETGEKVPFTVHDLSHDFSPWIWFRGFFWDERLKTQRRVQNAPLKIWGGVTVLGILLTISFIWWASETVAWYVLSLPIFVLLFLD